MNQQQSRGRAGRIFFLRSGTDSQGVALWLLNFWGLSVNPCIVTFLLLIPLLGGCIGSRSALPTAVPAATVAAGSQFATTTILPATHTPRPLVPTATRPPTVTPCVENGRIVQITFPSATAGGSMRARLYLPPCYGSDGRSYPTLYMLPGNIHTDAIWDDLGLDEAATAAIQAGQIGPLLIVMAAGGWIANNSSGGPGSYETVIHQELVPFIEENYCAWAAAAGRAIGGVSRGGYWALEIAFRHPQSYASVGGHSAALLDQFAGPAINPQYTGLSNDLGDLRIYLDIGADDYLIANIRRLHEEMETAAIAHTWRLNEGTHADAYWAAHVGDYLAWYSEPWPTSRAAYPLCTNQ